MAQTETLLREDLVVALPQTLLLASQSSIALKDLADEPLLICPRTVRPEFYDQVLQHCQEAGFIPNICQEVTLPDAAIAFVAAGRVSLVANHYQMQPTPGVVFRPLQELLPPPEVAITWRRDCASEVLRQLLVVLETHQQIESLDRSFYIR